MSHRKHELGPRCLGWGGMKNQFCMIDWLASFLYCLVQLPSNMLPKAAAAPPHPPSVCVVTLPVSGSSHHGRRPTRRFHTRASLHHSTTRFFLNFFFSPCFICIPTCPIDLLAASGALYVIMRHYKSTTGPPDFSFFVTESSSHNSRRSRNSHNT